MVVMGMILLLLGGISAGSFYIPLKHVRGWSWESGWITNGLFSWVICPVVAVALTAPGFGAAGRIIHETLLPVLSPEDETARGVLLFEPAGSVTVQSYALDRTFQEGSDYTVEGRILRLTPSSAIPFLTEEQLFPDHPDAEPGTMKAWQGGYVAFTEGSFWNGHQVSVRYPTEACWTGPVPQSRPGHLTRTREKLRNAEGLNVVLLGDSISVGASASGRSGRSPFVPGYGDLFVQWLRQQTGSPVRFTNLSLGGTRSEWGLKVAQTYGVQETPDLCIIAFGMNDGMRVPVEQYRQNIQAIIEVTQQSNPSTEFILVDSWPPNARWRSLAPMDGYLAALKTLESDTVAVADVWSMVSHMLQEKSYCDITGNHVNHPNDLIVRLYAQVLAALLE